MLALIIRFGLSIILQWAFKSGRINLVEEELLKFGMSLKTYPGFPKPEPESTNEHNFTVGKKPNI